MANWLIGKEANIKTHIEILGFKPLSQEARLDEAVKLLLSYRVMGELRENFTQQRIEEAYVNRDVDFRVTSIIELRKRILGFAFRCVKRIKLVRKAIFYWCRDRSYTSRIRVMVVDEYGRSSVVDSIEQLHSKLLDYLITLDLTGSELGKGEHTLRCDVKVKWGTHTFIQRGKASITTQPIQVVIL
ncbi:MAG: hypothetical protein HA494_00215 [Thaumarchaeota archaeon]|nr:hypothetical protein [Nitrososphaerota archaeon]